MTYLCHFMCFCPALLHHRHLFLAFHGPFKFCIGVSISREIVRILFGFFCLHSIYFGPNVRRDELELVGHFRHYRIFVFVFVYANQGLTTQTTNQTNFLSRLPVPVFLTSNIITAIIHWKHRNIYTICIHYTMLRPFFMKLTNTQKKHTINQ